MERRKSYFTCSFRGCPNYLGQQNKVSGEDITSFHRFPKNVDVRKQWVKSCRAGHESYYIDTNTARVCSLHFNKDDFERDLKAELLKLPAKKRLKSGAIPRSIHFHQESGKCARQRTQRQRAKEQREFVEALLSSTRMENSSVEPEGTPHNVDSQPESEETLSYNLSSSPILVEESLTQSINTQTATNTF